MDSPPEAALWQVKTLTPQQRALVCLIARLGEVRETALDPQQLATAHMLTEYGILRRSLCLGDPLPPSPFTSTVVFVLSAMGTLVVAILAELES